MVDRLEFVVIRFFSCIIIYLFRNFNFFFVEESNKNSFTKLHSIEILQRFYKRLVSILLVIDSEDRKIRYRRKSGWRFQKENNL